VIPLQTSGIEPLDIVSAQVRVRPLVAEHMVDHDEDAVRHSHDRLMDASPHSTTSQMECV
jgi:hypothetical protein